MGETTKNYLDSGLKPNLPCIEQRGPLDGFGHWECDLVHGFRRTGYILTAVERSTGLLFISHCPKKRQRKCLYGHGRNV